MNGRTHHNATPTPTACGPLPDWALPRVTAAAAPGPPGGSAPAPSARGWKLNNGTVLCRACRPRPAEAVPVVLAGEGDDLRWEEVLEESTPEPLGGGGARPPAQTSGEYGDGGGEHAADDLFGEF